MNGVSKEENSRKLGGPGLASFQHIPRLSDHIPGPGLRAKNFSALLHIPSDILHACYQVRALSKIKWTERASRSSRSRSWEEVQKVHGEEDTV